MEQELYHWQEECLNQWIANNGRGMVQAVTGSGKTLLALAADRLSQNTELDLRIKIVVPTGALLRQWNRALKAFLNKKGVKENKNEQKYLRTLPFRRYPNTDRLQVYR